MRSKVIILFTILSLVKSEIVLFKKGYIKYIRNGKREVLYNVSAIDDRIIDISKNSILVKTKSMPVLYSKSVNNLPRLQDINMAGCGIRSIASTAFFKLPNLSSIHLQDNNLREIKNNVFNGLPIKILSLQRNMIKQIESHAFNDMPNLYRIKLNSNNLKIWDLNWFKNSPKLSELYFRRNRINYLPPFAFSNIKGTHLSNGNTVTDTKIFLSKNKLGVISPASFYNMTKVGQLYLDRNNLTKIPDYAFRDLKYVDVIYLVRNKINEVSENAFSNIEKIGILDLSNNALKCLPYKLVSVANLTNLENNSDASCKCASTYKARLNQEDKKNELTC